MQSLNSDSPVISFAQWMFNARYAVRLLKACLCWFVLLYIDCTTVTSSGEMILYRPLLLLNCSENKRTSWF